MKIHKFRVEFARRCYLVYRISGAIRRTNADDRKFFENICIAYSKREFLIYSLNNRNEVKRTRWLFAELSTGSFFLDTDKVPTQMKLTSVS